MFTCCFCVQVISTSLWVILALKLLILLCLHAFLFSLAVRKLAFDNICLNFDISAEDGKETVNSDAPENNPQYTTVYVGNLAPEVIPHS